MPNLPTITLDTTLADLYRRASPKHADKRIAQIFCGINSGCGLSANVPRNAKYIYQDSPFNAVPEDESSSKCGDKRLQQELAVKYLSLIPQRDAFISGDCPVIFFNIDDTDKQRAHDRREAESTVSVLAEHQRPSLVFCAGPSQIPVEEAGIDTIAYKIVLDGLDQHNVLIPPETHWFLNSKAALAGSGLPTPRCKILELDGLADEGRLCCARCRGDDAEFVIPSACTGARGAWFRAQSERIFAELAAHPLPFVLKNQQTFGGAGTYIVGTEEQRAGVVADLRGGILRKLLSSVTAANAHLRPAALVLSDLVADPVGDYGLTFFVTDDGSDPIFLAASEQMINDDKAWIGSTINYDRQDQLMAKFGPLVKRIAEWLRGYGYVGPAGADVLETKPSKGPGPATNGNGTNGHSTNGHSTNGHGANGHGANGHATNGNDDFSNYHVVDLNVRTSGSMCLPLLKQHFTSRGLWSASSFSVSSKKGRAEFIESFRQDFEAGRMCVVSWYEDRSAGTSLADVAVGAEDEEALQEAMRRVRDATEGVTF
ncbi:hypothetical protein EsH8_II_001493 [Colletotrichum jinshuiense]